MMMKKLLVLGVLALFFSCNLKKDGTEKTLFVSSETKPCQAGELQKDCILVKYAKDQNEWEFFYNDIEGFNYEKGYEYELVVKEEVVENPPMDASSLSYTLVKEVSKVKVNK